MKATIELNIDKYLKKQIETGFYLQFDRMGVIWMVYEYKGVKHLIVAKDRDLKEWGIEKLELE